MSFETANGTLILSPENHQFLRGVTPPELLILKEMHFRNANGSPLANDFYIQKTPALTIDAPAIPEQEAYFDQNRGKHVDAKPAVLAKTHHRTQAEEIARLKKKYTGNITKDGQAFPAFVAVFGSATNVKLPETFEDVAPLLGIAFNAGEAPATADDQSRAFELNKLARPDLVDLALKLKLTVDAKDSKEFIIAAIINAENKLQDAEPETEPQKPALATAKADLESRLDEELAGIAKGMKVKKPAKERAELINQILEAGGYQ